MNTKPEPLKRPKPEAEPEVPLAIVYLLAEYLRNEEVLEQEKKSA